YVRLTGVLRNRIESGEWGEGQRLPSIERLCDEYDLARNTVRQALQLLKSDGLIGGGPGVGTVVFKASGRARDHQLKEAISDPLHLGADQSIEVLRRRKGVTVPDSLRRDLPVCDAYTHVRKIHRYRGQPFALMDIYVASHVYDRFPKGQDARI